LTNSSDLRNARFTPVAAGLQYRYLWQADIGRASIPRFRGLCGFRPHFPVATGFGRKRQQLLCLVRRSRQDIRLQQQINGKN
jgi:hypothetical protein